ncbi:hypothetical protein WJR50_09895 [Catalinimonas sp. 4WD22]|uniref:hypothetical protein n=1 Tax=Catalinimonas locisalis TaxID=3133978 RepID=UPI0031017AE8
MSSINYVQIVIRNLLLAAGIILLVDLALADVLQQGSCYPSVLFHTLVFGTLAGLAVSAYEILLELNIRKKAKHKKLLLTKVNQGENTSYFVRLIRVFFFSSIFCLLLIVLISFFETYPLSVYIQLSVVPVFLTLVANIPQSYTLFIDLHEQRQKSLNVIQNSLRDSVFEMNFKDKYHLEYKLGNPLGYLYAYCFAPDRCTIDMLIYQNHIEIMGSCSYLEALMNDPYISQMIAEKQKKDKDQVA